MENTAIIKISRNSIGALENPLRVSSVCLLMRVSFPGVYFSLLCKASPVSEVAFMDSFELKIKFKLNCPE